MTILVVVKDAFQLNCFTRKSFILNKVKVLVYNKNFLKIKSNEIHNSFRDIFYWVFAKCTFGFYIDQF